MHRYWIKLVGLMGLVVISACASPLVLLDPSIDSSSLTADSYVQNGTVYDRAVIHMGEMGKLVLPENATVERSNTATQVELYLAKTLGFMGHPPEKMTLKDVRNYMGCATKTEDNALVVAAYGEWTSPEGGAQLRLVAVVPEGVDIEQRDGLAGSDSAANKLSSDYITKPAEAMGGYWYGSVEPSEGWIKLTTRPDPNWKAKASKKSKESKKPKATDKAKAAKDDSK